MRRRALSASESECLLKQTGKEEYVEKEAFSTSESGCLPKQTMKEEYVEKESLFNF